MHAARVLGYQFVGLDNLLAEKFQFEMDKRHQKADWAVRPLTPAQLDYARLDTHFLFDLRDVLEAELKEKDRLQIAQRGFCARLSCGSARRKSQWNVMEAFQHAARIFLRAS